MGSPAVQTTAKRQFAAQAAVARSERELVKAEPLKVSTLKNGLNVASIENHSPITTLGVILKAGSRSETHDNAGISHSLRIAAGLGTKTKTAFSICRNLQQVGASMVATQGREHTLYTVQATRDQTDVAVEYLTEVVSNQAASAGKVVGAVAAALRSATVTEEEVAAAKKNMLADIYTLLEDPLQQVENMGAQLLVSG